MTNQSPPLWPRYPAPEHLGCAACRDAFGPERFGDRTVPPPFVPVGRRLGRRTPPWARSFYACSECDSIWLLAFSPKELTYAQSPTPLGTSRALRPEATLDEVMVPLFAPAPVGTAIEGALWQLTYEPQELWDRLLVAWRHPEVGVARRAIILRQLGLLLRPANPHHRELARRRGWLLRDLRGIGADLAELDAELADEDSPWQAFREAADDLATLRGRMDAFGVLQRDAEEEPEPQPSPHPHVQPAGRALAGQGATVEGDDHRAGGSPAARTMQLLRPYWNYLPTILLGWLLVERVGGAVEGGQRWFVQSFFFGFVLVASGSGAATSAGIGEARLFRTFLHRLSVISDLLYLALLSFLVVLGYVALAEPFDSGLEHPWHRFGIGAVALLPLTRLWPTWVIPFMQPVELDIESAKSMGNIRRPAVATAWRMTREPATFRRRTLPWFLAFALAVAATVVASRLGGATARSLVLYPLVLPLLTAYTWSLIEPMPFRDEDEEPAR
jgi:hypothetical protein